MRLTTYGSPEGVHCRKCVRLQFIVMYLRLFCVYPCFIAIDLPSLVPYPLFLTSFPSVRSLPMYWGPPYRLIMPLRAASIHVLSTIASSSTLKIPLQYLVPADAVFDLLDDLEVLQPLSVLVAEVIGLVNNRGGIVLISVIIIFEKH